MKGVYYDKENAQKIERDGRVAIFRRQTEDGAPELVFGVDDIEIIAEDEADVAMAINALAKEYGIAKLRQIIEGLNPPEEQAEPKLSDADIRLLGFRHINHVVNAIRKDLREEIGLSEEQAQELINEETIKPSQIIRAAKKRNFGL